MSAYANRGIGVALGALALVLAATGPVSAHTELTGSDPAAGSTMRAMPRQVELTFSAPVGTPAFVEVTTASGQTLATGEPQIDGRTVIQAVAAGASGRYTISYRVTASDGHPIAGTIRFRVAETNGAGRDRSDADAGGGRQDGHQDEQHSGQHGAPAEPEPSAVAQTSTNSETADGEGVPAGLLVGLGFLLLAGAAVVVLSTRRRSIS